MDLEGAVCSHCHEPVSNECRAHFTDEIRRLRDALETIRTLAGSHTYMLGAPEIPGSMQHLYRLADEALEGGAERERSP